MLFDCYGTLLRISRPAGVTRRYAAITRGSDGPSPLTSGITLRDALLARGVETVVADAIGRDALLEADSVEPLGDAVDAVNRLLDQGIGVAVVSNLSTEYAAPIRRLLPDVKHVLSFETGCAKPQPGIYKKALLDLGVRAEEAVMIGDSRRCDHDGPLSLGIRPILIKDHESEGIRTAPDVSRALGMAGLSTGAS